MSSFSKKKADLISIRQIRWLIISIIASTGIAYMPSMVIGIAGKSAWISIFVAGLVSLFLISIILYTNSFFEQKTIFEYSPLLLGKVLGSIVSLVYLVLLFFELMYVTYEIAKIAEANYIYVHRSPVILSILGYILSIYMLNGGIGIIARVNDFMMAPILLFFLFLFALDIPFIRIDRILPLAPENWMDVGKGIPLPLVFFSEISLISILWGHSRKENPNKKVKSTVLFIFFILILIICLLILTIISTFGEERASTLSFPLFTLGKEILYGDFLSNFQILLLPGILIFVTVKISIFLFALESGIKKLGWKSFQTIIPYLLGSMTIIFTFLTIRSQENLEYQLFTIGTKVILPLLVLIHLLLWIILLVKKKFYLKN